MNLIDKLFLKDYSMRAAKENVIVPVPSRHIEMHPSTEKWYRYQTTLMPHFQVFGGSKLTKFGMFGPFVLGEALDHFPAQQEVSNMGRNWEDEEQCTEVLFGAGSRFPLPERLPVQLTTPEGLSWFITHSIGHYLLHRVDPPKDEETHSGVYYEVDTTKSLKDLELQHGCTPLCCKATFHSGNNNGNEESSFKLIKLQHNDKVLSGEKEFSENAEAFADMCRAFATAVFTIVAICEHLLRVHTWEACVFVSASIKYLPARHPVRRLLAMCEFGVFEVQEEGVPTLQKLMTRYFNFTSDGLNTLSKRYLEQFDFQRDIPLPHFLKCRGIISATDETHIKDHNFAWCPALEDSRDWWVVFEDHVTRWFKIYYEDGDKAVRSDKHLCKWWEKLPQIGSPTITKGRESLEDCPNALAEVVRLCTTFMYSSAIDHEKAGADSYMLASNPYVISSQWREGKTLEERINGVWVSRIKRDSAYVTTARSPHLLTDWSYMVSKKGPKEHVEAGKAEMKLFEKEMEQLGERFAERNKARKIPYEKLLPQKLGCSVAI